MILTFGRVAAVLFLTIGAQPGIASERSGSSLSGEHRSGVFAGAALTVPFGRGTAARPRAGLRLTTTHQYRDGRSAEIEQRYRNPALELRFSGSGNPRIYVAGQSAAEMERRLGVNGSTTWLIVGGVAVILVAAIVLSNGNDCPDEGISCGPL